MSAVPFLDSEDEAFTVSFPRARPWKTYWPPNIEGDLHVWLQRNNPEVLSWRFNHKDPFNRPWQRWARQTWIHSGQVKSRDQPDDGLDEDEQEPSNDQFSSESDVSTTRYMSLANKIKQLKLVWVVPDEFNYLAPYKRYATEKPFHSRLPFLGGLRRTNITGRAYHNVPVFDVKGHEEYFQLQESGFEFRDIPTSVVDWNDTAVRGIYLPEMARWLQAHFHSKTVFVYAYNFRCSDTQLTKSEPWIKPYLRAHADVTENSCRSKLKLHFNGNIEQYKNRRARFINIWRPLNGPVLTTPLAVLDARSLRRNDLVEADVVFPHHCDEGYEVRYNADHRWFYKSNMAGNNAIMFKMFDTNIDEAQVCVHSAFVDPSIGSENIPRASVEMRAIVLD